TGNQLCGRLENREQQAFGFVAAGPVSSDRAWLRLVVENCILAGIQFKNCRFGKIRRSASTKASRSYEFSQKKYPPSSNSLSRTPVVLHYDLLRVTRPCLH